MNSRGRAASTLLANLCGRSNTKAAVSVQVRLLRLSSTNFRNLAVDDLEFSPGINLFLGQNGQGKTNLLEVVFFFKFGKSFRTARDAELIRFGESYCRSEVCCAYENGEEEIFSFSLEEDGTKRIKTGGREIARLSELVGLFPAVLFGPQDLKIVSGFPSERRRYIDMVGSMASKKYLELLKEYRRIISQRNALLKGEAEHEEARAWNEKLVVKGSELARQRKHLVHALDGVVAECAGTVGSACSFGMSYRSSVGNGSDALEEQFAEKLRAVEAEEFRRGITLAGPHRDDVDLLIEGRDVRKYGSQGQKKLFAVLLRLAEMLYLEKRLQEPCALLLDDVFSELDSGVGNRLKSALSSANQIFITSPNVINWRSDAGACVYRVESGRVVVQC